MITTNTTITIASSTVVIVTTILVTYDIVHRGKYVAGVQLVKMSPFRSNTATGFTVLIMGFLGILQLKGGVTTYCVVSQAAVVITVIVSTNAMQNQQN